MQISRIERMERYIDRMSDGYRLALLFVAFLLFMASIVAWARWLQPWVNS